MAIYQVIYKDENGNSVHEATFNASGPREAIRLIVTVPSMQPPENADSMEVKRIDSPPAAA